MEEEERPAKLRKLNHEAVSDDVSNNGPELPSLLSTEPINQPQDVVTADENSNGADATHNSTRINQQPGDSAAITQESQTNGDAPLSKNQQKKLRRQQEWEAKRAERKVIRKEKTLAKRERRRQAKREATDEIAASAVQSMTKPKSTRAVQLPVTFLIDCDFDDLMSDKERISLAAQITRSYSDNRNSMFRAHLAVCSFTGKLRERFDNVLDHYKGWRGVRFLDDDFIQASAAASAWMTDETQAGKLTGAFASYAELDAEAQANLKDNGEVVYLTSEADNTLTELKPYSTYIIGGLVDKNREKGLCYKRARQLGVKTARLPIGEFMEMQSRKVLATNHVNEIMLKWLECGDWGEAFLKAIPKRKGGRLKAAIGEGEGGEPNSHDEHENQEGDEDDKAAPGGRLTTNGDGCGVREASAIKDSLSKDCDDNAASAASPANKKQEDES